MVDALILFKFKEMDKEKVKKNFDDIKEEVKIYADKLSVPEIKELVNVHRMNIVASKAIISGCIEVMKSKNKNLKNHETS